MKAGADPRHHAFLETREVIKRRIHCMDLPRVSEPGPAGQNFNPTSRPDASVSTSSPSDLFMAHHLINSLEATLGIKYEKGEARYRDRITSIGPVGVVFCSVYPLFSDHAVPDSAARLPVLSPEIRRWKHEHRTVLVAFHPMSELDHTSPQL